MQVRFGGIFISLNLYNIYNHLVTIYALGEHSLKNAITTLSTKYASCFSSINIFFLNYICIFPNCFQPSTRAPRTCDIIKHMLLVKKNANLPIARKKKIFSVLKEQSFIYTRISN